MGRRRRKFLKAVGTASIIGVAGCTQNGDQNGGGGSPTGTQPDPADVVGDGSTDTPTDEGGGSSDYWTQQEERLKEAAEQAPDEPQLMLYFNYRPGAMQEIINDFKQHAQDTWGFNPNVDFYRAAAAKVASRVESEKRAGQLQASYVGISAPGAIRRWSNNGWTADWLPPALQNYPGSVIHRELNMHTGTWWMPMCITIGPGVYEGNTPQPEGYAQQVQMSEFCGNMTSYDMMLGGGASWYHTSFMHDKLTEGGISNETAGLDTPPSWEAYTEDFYQQDPFFSPSSFNMIQQVGRGEYDAHLMSLLGWSVLLRDTQDVPVREVFPESGVPMFFNAEALFKDAPALNTAMLFQNWWLQEDVQEKFCDLEYCYSAHGDVAGLGATDMGPNLSELNVQLPNWREYADRRSDILDQIQGIKDETEPRC